jgi:dipeptide transport system permease protein
MITLIFKKIISLATTLIGVTLITFILVRLVPGDPVMLLIGERGANPEVYLEMKKKLGLDLPLPAQFFSYLKNIVRGDLGVSIVSHRPVTEEFFERFPATMELGLLALLWAIILGIPLGIYCAVYRGKLFDQVLTSISLIGYSMPIFWWGLILIIIFSVKLGLTPVSGRLNILFEIPNWTGFYLLDTLQKEVIAAEGFAPFKSAISHLLLPALCMGTIPLAIITRMTRSALLEVLGEDYIRTAHAKGNSMKRVLWIHAFRNALIPIITILGLMLGSVVTGAILTENIFSWPGLGKWMVASVTARDYPVVQGGVLLIASIIVITNMLTDLVYIWANPKLQDNH